MVKSKLTPKDRKPSEPGGGRIRKLAGRVLATFGVGEVFAVCGTAGLCYGAWLIYEPAGYLVGGSLFLAAGILIAYAAIPRPEGK